ncbi:MAG: efflux RND transporter periplasmic adaptor subunit [Cytophagales bacterium]|nr:MAG: efflux RND transporter periplasmic adaptor subunit [Cytophagales bacterium]
MKKSVRNIIFILIGVIILFIIVYPRLGLFSTENKQNNAGKSETKETEKKVESSIVKAKILKTENLEDNISTTGTLLAYEEVSLRSEISGKIVGVHFSEGDFVAQGALLITIYNEDLKAELKKLELNKELNQTKENRQKQLLEKEAISQQEYDIALNALNTVNTEIELKRLQIEKTYIRAPFGGIVGLRNISVGTYLTPSVEITKLASINPIKIQFAIPSKYSNIVRKGSKITFSVENSNQTYEGIVYAIEPKVDEATRTIILRATSPNTNNMLMAGDFAKIELTISNTPNVLLLPTEAIVPEMDMFKVFKVKNGKAISVTVKIGKRTEKEVEIVEGLQKGDTVITSGILKVKPDAPVTIQAYE